MAGLVIGIIIVISMVMIISLIIQVVVGVKVNAIIIKSTKHISKLTFRPVFSVLDIF
jgi:hypothetical protein